MAPLLVCRAFHPIARPLFYDIVVLHSPAQAQAFTLVSLVLTIPATPHIIPALAAMVRLLAGECPCECECECACEYACEELPHNAHHAAQAPPSAYSSPPPRAQSAVAQMLRRCAELYTLTTMFPLPASPASLPDSTPSYYTPPPRRHTVAAPLQHHTQLPTTTHSTRMQSTSTPQLSPAPAQRDGATELDTSLDLPTTLPPLRTLRTPLPAVWAPAFLRAAQNAGVERIVMDTGVQGADVSAGVRQRSASAPVAAHPYGSAPSTPPNGPPHLHPLAHPRPTSLFLAALLRAGMGDGVGGRVRGRVVKFTGGVPSSPLPRLVIAILRPLYRPPPSTRPSSVYPRTRLCIRHTCLLPLIQGAGNVDKIHSRDRHTKLPKDADADVNTR
ncbi:hypothetical protein C8J57DRAFT_1615928 [Mycena rebaudengoi]|nr:hypothetical protein C8J57DRAFT_1615928 [Mycena rebaudengoi]